MEILKFDLNSLGNKFKTLNATNGGPCTKGMPTTSSAVIFQITRLHEYRIAETMIPVFAAFTADHTATIFHAFFRISMLTRMIPLPVIFLVRMKVF